MARDQELELLKGSIVEAWPRGSSL